MAATAAATAAPAISSSIRIPRQAKRLPTRYADYPLRAGDVFRLDTPGGGGYGDPREREPERVRTDVAEGYVTPAAAERDYGVGVAETERGFAKDAPTRLNAK